MSFPIGMNKVSIFLSVTADRTTARDGDCYRQEEEDKEEEGQMNSDIVRSLVKRKQRRDGRLNLKKEKKRNIVSTDNAERQTNLTLKGSLKSNFVLEVFFCVMKSETLRIKEQIKTPL